jgi:hypothetical protein
MEDIDDEKRKLLTIMNKCDYANDSAIFEPRKARKDTKIQSTEHTERTEASQTSAMVLKSLFAENKSLVMMYLDGLRLLGGFDALRAGESDVKLNYGILL